jgi:hypothetical protein
MIYTDDALREIIARLNAIEQKLADIHNCILHDNTRQYHQMKDDEYRRNM